MQSLGNTQSGRNFLLTCMKPIERASAESKLLGTNNLLGFRTALILKLSRDLMQYCPILEFSPCPVKGLVFMH